MLLWTIIPTWFARTIPRDTAEGIAWGYEWQMGYWKHPPLAAWLSNLVYIIQGYPGFTLYLLSQICVGITFWAVWKLACEILTQKHALASVFCLLGIYYYSFPAMKFNPDILVLPLWALLILYIL